MRKILLHDRLRQLVDDHDGGNAREAARRVGMAPMTFADILNGLAKNPRRYTLEKIARAYGVSGDWLSSGEGRGPNSQDPASPIPQVASYRWQRILEEIAPDPGHLRTELAALPLTMGHAIESLPFRVGFSEPGGPNATAVYRDECLSPFVNAWVRLFQFWIDEWGVDAVRQALSTPDVLERLRSGFREPANAETRPKPLPRLSQQGPKRTKSP